MEGREIRCWDELIPDALELIFCNLSLKEKLTVIPRICKSWRKSVMGPYCWQEIDIEDWSWRRRPELLDRMLQMLINRSSGSPWKLRVFGLPNDATFSLIADHAGSLQTLQMRGSKISDSIVEQVAGRLCAITFLDLSCCAKIGASALKAIGNNCKLLSGLRRMMDFPINPGPRSVFVVYRGGNEAHAIAITMPNLKYLDIRCMSIATKGVSDIISGCRKLVSLDLRGCTYLKLDEKFLNEKCSGLKVHMGIHIFYDCSDSSGYFADWFWEYEQRLEELEP